MIDAECPEKACSESIKIANQEHGYGPKEDGGFIAIVAYDRSDLQGTLDEMDGRRDQS
jgi:hypothetical protein